MARLSLPVVALTRAAFAPFGDVVEIEGRDHYPINGGTAERYHDLAQVDVLAEGGRPLVSIVRAQPTALPLRLRLMERHPLSSQAFLPLSAAPFAVVVARPGAAPGFDDLRAFVSNGRQGVNYRAGTWHHPLIALDRLADFLVVDRGGPGDNCDERPFEAEEIVLAL